MRLAKRRRRGEHTRGLAGLEKVTGGWRCLKFMVENQQQHSHERKTNDFASCKRTYSLARHVQEKTSYQTRLKTDAGGASLLFAYGDYFSGARGLSGER